jgi:hypothetical protein
LGVFEGPRGGFILGGAGVSMKLVLMAMAVARLVVAGDSTLGFFPGDTKVVFGIHVRAIADSALFKDAGTDAQRMSAEWLKVVAITGFDPLHDIDEVLMASSADKENAPAILVLRGRFDLTRMGVGAPRYHGVAMVGDGKGGKSVLALVDAATGVAGDTMAVRAAIDRHGQGAALESALAARVQSLRERFDLWGMGERPKALSRPPARTSNSIRWTASSLECASARESNWRRRYMRGRRKMRRSWRHR